MKRRYAIASLAVLAANLKLGQAKAQDSGPIDNDQGLASNALGHSGEGPCHCLPGKVFADPHEGILYYCDSLCRQTRVSCECRHKKRCHGR